MLSTSQKRKVGQTLRGKILLVTGGTGSFGKSIVKELLAYKPKEIRIFSRSEDKQEEMKYLFGDNKALHFILGDVRDTDQVKRAMVKVDYVFHAAAQKQVPRTEYNVLEAIKTNILGAQNVIDACLSTKSVKKVIAISTDKAVEPVNAMGMTKALQEKLFTQANLEKNGKKIAFCCVRYGNVFGSTGSVIPYFMKLIQANKNITVTHRDMTRFLILLEDAVQLVLLALIDTRGGEIYIPIIPSHGIVALATSLLQLSGKQKKLKIVTSGIRVGEKLHETLISPTESTRTIITKDYYKILPDITIPELLNDLQKVKKNQMFRYSSDTAKKLSTIDLEKILKRKLSFSL